MIACICMHVSIALAVPVDSVVILHTEVVDYEDKQDGARDMAEQARGGGFVETERRQQGNNSCVAQLT